MGEGESRRGWKGKRNGRPAFPPEGRGGGAPRAVGPGKAPADASGNAPFNDKDVRFGDLLMQLARRSAPDVVRDRHHPEPLAGLDYDKELDLKNRALQEFWTARGLPDKPNRILPSPRPRGYRTTTKRRVISRGGGFALSHLTGKAATEPGRAQAESKVEPPEHKAIYAFLAGKLNTEAYHGLAKALNYVIIRGGYDRLTVLFNVHRLNADVVRKAKLLGGHLQAPEWKVASAFLFFDPSRSEFYFEARDPEGPWKLKKLFGPDDIRLALKDFTYVFQPTAFCQVNASILPDFLDKAAQLLKPKPPYRLIDLYCGYGFFTLPLSRNYAGAWGIDLGGPAIASARKMAAAGTGGRVHFEAGRITAKTLERMLPPAAADAPEALLLDPPRQGTEPGVIRALAARRPARILHIFCDMDTLPREVNLWRKAGYMVSKVVPLDMFPGTDDLEVMVLFIPDRYGILNRIDKERFQRTRGFDGTGDVDGDLKPAAEGPRRPGRSPSRPWP